ncbi:MAG: hypothetical protein K2Z81_08125, partial [Cyanobacteria bacterium]|nr:hypothetical protein [Cyanobacteriota bacterium]
PMAVDEQGNRYPARQYNMNPGAMSDYHGESDESSDDSTAQKKHAPYRLGPDTDILDDGKVVMHLTESGYLVLNSDRFLVMDQKTGKPIMSLYGDPSLLFHVNREIRRQQHSIEAAALANSADLDSNAAPRVKQDVAKMRQHAELLKKAADILGELPDAAPKPSSPPAGGAIELFVSTWLLPDGRFILLKRPDGSVQYLDGKALYSDAGKTRLSDPYPNEFKTLLVAYMSNLNKQTAAVRAGLAQAKQEVQTRLTQLNQDLKQFSTAGKPDQMVQFGPDSVPVSEAVRRTKLAIGRAQHRLNWVQSHLDQLPSETKAAAKSLTQLGSVGG